jgi:hypothetical protein
VGSSGRNLEHPRANASFSIDGHVDGDDLAGAATDVEIDGAAADGTVLDRVVGAALGLDLDGKVLPAVGALDLSVFGEIYGRGDG